MLMQTCGDFKIGFGIEIEMLHCTFSLDSIFSKCIGKLDSIYCAKP